MKQTTILFFYICFILSSCNLFQGGDLPTDTYEGFFTSGFEVSKLKPCSRSDQEWWVTGGNRVVMDSLISKYKSLTDHSSEEAQPFFS